METRMFCKSRMTWSIGRISAPIPQSTVWFKFWCRWTPQPISIFELLLRRGEVVVMAARRGPALTWAAGHEQLFALQRKRNDSVYARCYRVVNYAPKAFAPGWGFSLQPPRWPW